MNNLIKTVTAEEIPANCEEVKLFFKNGTSRCGYIVKTRKLSPFYFFICNQKLFNSREADIEVIPADKIAYFDPILK